jgi:hypothetical protein
MDPQNLVFKDRKPSTQSPQNKTAMKPNLKKLDSKTYVPRGQEIFHEESDEDSDGESYKKPPVKKQVTINIQNTDSTPMN